jgi:drug/metabolite transporter (DMT)-like permease
VTLGLAFWLGMGAKPRRSEIATSLGVLVSMGALVAVTWYGKSGLGNFPADRLHWGVAMAFLCGISMAINTTYSKRLNARGWSARKILAHRFYALLALAALALPTGAMGWLSVPSHAMTILTIAFGGVIVPLYAFQRGVEYLEPVVVALILATVPLFSLVVQTLDRRLEFSAYSLGGILLVILFSCLGVLVRSGKLARPRAAAIPIMAKSA